MVVDIYFEVLLSNILFLGNRCKTWGKKNQKCKEKFLETISIPP